ncbi:SoxR reducing system RseC family protein [Chromatium okenii]|jgi:sigma-E factor negative regulatory protein RseC|uniref:Fis family transcriptional regulator n=1 Tax=Chromatium okenii TaxID=61644 RepID=A0A2S7XSZ3_9GAMM|nr:SoxR reducing system RseC family protein [Chromatium okenii]MBV5308691.1 SoxR reducing system RseC family protein [Chromatium okenii]PQJ96521.1 Fis family transcriptional regulator [Chromatium okenii]
MPLNAPVPEHPIDPFSADLVEGVARVVAVKGDRVWLEPELTSSCGGCAASGLCGAKGIGTAANRLEIRRFELVNAAQLVVGERVIIGVDGRALLKASVTAYALPLVIMLSAGAVAQNIAQSDGVTMIAMASGLAFGLLLARWIARWLSTRGQLAPRFLRRADAEEACKISSLES